MNEEFKEIESNGTWELVPNLNDNNFISLKLVFNNKINEEGQVVRNEEILVDKGYEQIVGKNFE